MYFRYDGDTPICLEFDGVEYYYVTNLQGDVIAILNDSGTCVAEYSYDAWGNCTVTKATDTIAYDNPLRYRGYYYDYDTELYYLQSRFYDANTGRFINADEPTLIGANGGVVSNNLFAYCDNNPVMKSDPTGHIAANVIGVIIGGIIGAVGGYFLTNWLADKIDLKGWKRKIFVWGLSAIIGAAAATIGYFIGPYVAKAWSWLSAKLAGLLKGTYKTIGKISASKMKYKINVSKHLWSKVLGKKVTTTGIKNLIYKTIAKGTWKVMNNGSVRIILQYGKNTIVVTGSVVNKVFKIGDAWVWNGVGSPWGK